MNPADAIPIALLILFGTAVGIGGTIVWLAVRWHRQLLLSSRFRASWTSERSRRPPRRGQHFHARRPTVWLAIRSRDSDEVFRALALSDQTPCSWLEAIHGWKGVVISPPIRGWVLVVGTAVPDPAADVDACFRFLLELSRKLGHVQFFQADRVLFHHAWARLEAGRVVRAYAWAGATLWHQGFKSVAETSLGVKCFAYGEESNSARFGVADLLAANVEKVPLLAARWSLDPAEVETLLPGPVRGIAGKTSVRY